MEWKAIFVVSIFVHAGIILDFVFSNFESKKNQKFE
jgi:hypothetical protein